ncbi:hypothetical protein BpHYR1_041161, partial [Brachionus plicatilis]
VSCETPGLNLTIIELGENSFDLVAKKLVVVGGGGCWRSLAYLIIFLIILLLKLVFRTFWIVHVPPRFHKEL